MGQETIQQAPEFDAERTDLAYLNSFGLISRNPRHGDVKASKTGDNLFHHRIEFGASIQETDDALKPFWETQDEDTAKLEGAEKEAILQWRRASIARFSIKIGNDWIKDRIKNEETPPTDEKKNAAYQAMINAKETLNKNRQSRRKLGIRLPRDWGDQKDKDLLITYLKAHVQFYRQFIQEATEEVNATKYMSRRKLLQGMATMAAYSALPRPLKAEQKEQPLEKRWVIGYAHQFELDEEGNPQFIHQPGDLLIPGEDGVGVFETRKLPDGREIIRITPKDHNSGKPLYIVKEVTTPYEQTWRVLKPKDVLQEGIEQVQGEIHNPTMLYYLVVDEYGNKLAYPFFSDGSLLQPGKPGIYLQVIHAVNERPNSIGGEEMYREPGLRKFIMIDDSGLCIPLDAMTTTNKSDVEPEPEPTPETSKPCESWSDMNKLSYSEMIAFLENHPKSQPLLIGKDAVSVHVRDANSGNAIGGIMPSTLLGLTNYEIITNPDTLKRLDRMFGTREGSRGIWVQSAPYGGSIASRSHTSGDEYLSRIGIYGENGTNQCDKNAQSLRVGKEVLATEGTIAVLKENSLPELTPLARSIYLFGKHCELNPGGIISFNEKTAMPQRMNVCDGAKLLRRLLDATVWRTYPNVAPVTIIRRDMHNPSKDDSDGQPYSYEFHCFGNTKFTYSVIIDLPGGDRTIMKIDDNASATKREGFISPTDRRDLIYRYNVAQGTSLSLNETSSHTVNAVLYQFLRENPNAILDGSVILEEDRVQEFPFDTTVGDNTDLIFRVGENTLYFYPTITVSPTLTAPTGNREQSISTYNALLVSAMITTSPLPDDELRQLRESNNKAIRLLDLHAYNQQLTPIYP